MSAPVILWLAMAAVLAILIGYRKVVAGATDELVHVSDPSMVAIQKQEVTAKKLQQLDRVAIALGIVMVVYGLALAGFTIYQAFETGGKTF